MLSMTDFFSNTAVGNHRNSSGDMSIATRASVITPMISVPITGASARNTSASVPVSIVCTKFGFACASGAMPIIMSGMIFSTGGTMDPNRIYGTRDSLVVKRGIQTQEGDMVYCVWAITMTTPTRITTTGLCSIAGESDQVAPTGCSASRCTMTMIVLIH